jgi:NAD-dependent deacetylase
MSEPSDFFLPADLRRRLAAARSVVAFTGAGVSKESGLDTFRDAGGVWQRVRPEDLATPQAFRRDPERVWSWYAERFTRAAGVLPNPAHYALASWERLFPSFTLVTQNVDGLHQRAGSSDPLELHGSLRWARCDACGRRRPMAEAVAESPDAPPVCSCRGRLRPAVVWFGEPLPAETLERASEAAAWCEVFVSIGTSATVYPAAGLIELALGNGATLLEVNPEPTPFSRHSLRFDAPAGEALPWLTEQIAEEIRACRPST